MEFGFALESSVAIMENTCPPLHPTSFTPSAGSDMLTLIVVPSMNPDAEDITELANLSVKYLPDCEIVKSTSRIVVIDPAHGTGVRLGALACIFQRPPIALGAISLLPLLSTPASPNIGMITRIRYATAKFLLASITGRSFYMRISELQRAIEARSESRETAVSSTGILCQYINCPQSSADEDSSRPEGHSLLREARGWFNSVRPKTALTFRFGGLAIQVPDSLPLIFGGGL
jgi:hypothetical protein